MVDSHIHLADEIFEGHVSDILAEFALHDGTALLNIAHNFQYIDRSLAADFFQNIHPALQVYNAFGLHPTEFEPDVHTVSDVRKALRQLDFLVQQNKDVVHAIGECGFDFYRTANKDFEKTYELQEALFVGQLKMAARQGLPLVLHVRDKKGEDVAVKSTLGILAEHTLKQPVPSLVFHSFTGAPEPLQTIVDAGYFVGFNAIITYPSGKNVRELLRSVPLEQILLETDAPYLPTQATRRNKDIPSRQKYGRPVDILEIAQVVADVKSEPLAQVLRQTQENFYRFLGVG